MNSSGARMSTVNNSLEDWQNLAAWLNQERKNRNNISLRELARQAGISHGVLAKMANAQGPFTRRVLNAIADALDVPREKVLQLAGEIPDRGEVIPEVREWSARLRTLPAADRQRAIDLMDLALQAIERAGAGR